VAGALKQEFIEAVRLTPDGIVDFLATPLPAAPTISTPADADAAILASGILSKYLLDLFATFEGLTPIELLLRIGQHNSVLESAMLAGLEYIEGADSAENDITVLEPQDGVSYTPGEMRFIAKVSNGFCIGMTLTLGADPIKMVSQDDIFTQFVNMEVGDYTATFDASFEDTTTQTASVNFSVEEYDPENPPEPPLPPEEQPKPPGGTNITSFTRARDHVKSAYTKVIAYTDSENQTMLTEYINQFVAAVTDFARIMQQSPLTLQYAADRAAELIDLVIALPTNGDDLKNKSSVIMNKINTIFTELQG
jgi:hypothetical protein